MRKSEKVTKKTSNKKSKGFFKRLEDIHTLIDAPRFNQELVSEFLDRIKPDYLSPYYKVYNLYLNAKFHFNCYKQEDAIEHLELASGLLDSMDALAYQKKVWINNPDHHFTRAYIKFLLATLYWDEDSSPYYLEKAIRITDCSLNHHPKHKGFIWLKNQFAA